MQIFHWKYFEFNMLQEKKHIILVCGHTGLCVFLLYTDLYILGFIWCTILFRGIGSIQTTGRPKVGGKKVESVVYFINHLFVVLFAS